MFDHYKSRMAHRGANMSEMLRMQSNMVIEQTWERDPNYRQVYVVRVNHGLPEVTPQHELIDVKFNVASYQTLASDEVAYTLQFRHGESRKRPEISIGSYVYMEDEDGVWKWWLICHLDERPQFRQYQILECNWTFGWVKGGQIYRCLGVQRYQNSYNSGAWDADRTTAVDNITSMWLPTNADTQTIGYDQRFLISDQGRIPPICFAISKIEDTTPVGITKFKLTQETFDPNHDNAELMLADYYDSNIEPVEAEMEPELLGMATIVYSGAAATIKVGGSFKTFTPTFTGEDVTVDRWLVSDKNGDISADIENYTIKYDGDKLKLKVAQNYNLIGTVLIVQVVGSDGSVAELSVEVIG